MSMSFWWYPKIEMGNLLDNLNSIEVYIHVVAGP